MSGKTINSAILLLVIGNALAIGSDVFIKLLEPGAPILVMVLSAFFFREKLTPLSITAVFSGFAGIIVILRPVEFNWAAVAALGSAFALAINAVMVRQLPKEQSTVHKLFLNYLLIVPAAAALALWEGAEWDTSMLLSAAGSALFILGYNITVLLAYKQVDANQVTSAEYTGLIWAVGIGWIWFGEVPDLWFLAGSLMIVVPLVLIGLQHRRRSPARGFNPVGRDTDDNLSEQGPSKKASQCKAIVLHRQAVLRPKEGARS